MSYVTELLEVGADDPELHAVLIPGNPGFIRSYKDFVESLYEQLGGTASMTGLGEWKTVLTERTD